MVDGWKIKQYGYVAGEDCGLLDPSRSDRVCRQSTGMARDDWVTCPGTDNVWANQFYTAGGNTYCCVDESGWKWAGGGDCTCQYSQSVCQASSCNGQWTYDDICCFGDVVYDVERVGGSSPAYPTCGTLDPTCDDCFCGVPQ